MSIDAVYQELLGRNADASGRETYAGMSDDEVRAAISGSKEFASKGGKNAEAPDDWKTFNAGSYATAVAQKNNAIEASKSATTVNDLYKTILGRNADAGGIENYKDKSIEEVRASLLGSQEFGFLTQRNQTPVTEAEFKDRWAAFTNDSVYNLSPETFKKYSSLGMSLDEMEFHAANTREAKLSRLYETPKKRGDDFYAEHADTDEFTATREGQVVWLKDVTPVDSDYYEDVTDKYGGKVPQGYKAYIDKGSMGGGGWVESAGGLVGMNEFDSDSQNIFGKFGRTISLDPGTNAGATLGEFGGMNEGYALTDAFSLNTGTRIQGGQRMHEKSTDIYTEELGLQEGEFDRYADIGASVVVAAAATIGAYFTAGYSLYAIPAFTAWQGSSRRVGGTAAEQERESWGDVAENTAWATAAAAIGASSLNAVETGVAQGVLATAHAKSGGASWGDAAWQGAPAVAGGYSPYAGAAVSAAAVIGQGGTWEQAAIAGGTDLATYESGRYFRGNVAGAAAAAMGISFMGDLAAGKGVGVSIAGMVSSGASSVKRAKRYQKKDAAYSARGKEAPYENRVINKEYLTTGDKGLFNRFKKQGAQS